MEDVITPSKKTFGLSRRLLANLEDFWLVEMIFGQSRKLLLILPIGKVFGNAKKIYFYHLHHALHQLRKTLGSSKSGVEGSIYVLRKFFQHPSSN